MMKQWKVGGKDKKNERNIPTNSTADTQHN